MPQQARYNHTPRNVVKIETQSLSLCVNRSDSVSGSKCGLRSHHGTASEGALAAVRIAEHPVLFDMRFAGPEEEAACSPAEQRTRNCLFQAASVAWDTAAAAQRPAEEVYDMRPGSRLAYSGTLSEEEAAQAGSHAAGKAPGLSSSSAPQAVHNAAVVAAVEALRMAAVAAARDMRTAAMALPIVLARRDSKSRKAFAAGLASPNAASSLA